MKRLAGIWLVVLATAVAKADIVATLTVAPEQDVRLAPYATANLRLINQTPEAVETVLLRPGGGGPIIRYALAAAGGQEHTATVALPAISPVQKYEVTAVSPAGEVLGTTWAEITWPAECVATDVFLDDAYALWRDAGAGFAGPTRRNAVLLLAIFVTAAAATLLIRRGPWRLAILGLLIAAGVVLAFVVPAWGGGRRYRRVSSPALPRPTSPEDGILRRPGRQTHRPGATRGPDRAVSGVSRPRRRRR